MKKIIFALFLGLSLLGVGAMTVAQPAYAARCGGVDTSIIDCEEEEDDGEGGGIFSILRMVVQILTYAVGVLATIGIIIAAVQYTTAGDNTGQVATAKKRIFQIVLGLVAYALMTTAVNFLIPGGLF